MFERFTDRSRRVLVLAQEEARLQTRPFIDTEHLLLGLIGEGEGVGAKVLEDLGFTTAGMRELLTELQADVAPGVAPVTGSPPFTLRAKKVLELSLREALQLGHNYIGTEHMLLGLVREGEGVAAQMLATGGADLSRVRQAVITKLIGYAGTKEPPLSLRAPAVYLPLDLAVDLGEWIERWDAVMGPLAPSHPLGRLSVVLHKALS